MPFKWRISFVVVILCLLIKTLIAQPNFDVVSVELEKSEAKVNAGTDLRLILFADIDIGYHINSNKPRDKYLIPVTISSGNELFPISKVTF